MPKCFGSEGAAKIFAIADRVDFPGRRMLEAGELVLLFDSEGVHLRHYTEDAYTKIDRETTRIILRGVLSG